MAQALLAITIASDEEIRAGNFIVFLAFNTTPATIDLMLILTLLKQLPGRGGWCVCLDA
jgi:hypothetical protein